MAIEREWLVVAAGLCLAGPVLADDGDGKTAITVTPYLGGAHMKIDAEFLEDGVRRGEDLGLAGVSIGVRLPVGLTFEIGRSDAVHDNLFEWWSEGLGFTQKYAAVGWRIPLGDDWHLTPKYGRAKWELDADDVNLVLPDGELSDKWNGYDNFAEATLSKAISAGFGVGLTVRGIETGFGESISGAVGVTWSF
jgi:hypothetical protein